MTKRDWEILTLAVLAGVLAGSLTYVLVKWADWLFG